MKVRAEKLKIGPDLEAGTDMGPVIHMKSFGKLRTYRTIAVKEGGRLITREKNAPLSNWLKAVSSNRLSSLNVTEKT